MNTKIRGFTLIEILIALAVFAILATITSSAMYHAFNTRARVTKQADRLNTLQLAITMIGRDVQQTIERSIISNDMHLSPAFVGEGNYVEFTRSGLVNPNNLAKLSTLKRVAFICRGGQLIRRSWQQLDAPARKQVQDRILLTDLDECSFAYLARNRQILSEWRENAVQEDQRKETLPTAVQFTLTLHDWGNMSLLFIIPEALYAG